MKENHYCVELEATGHRYEDRFSGFGSAIAHFSTAAAVGEDEFRRARDKAVEFTWSQQKRWWTGYELGETFVQSGWRESDNFSPEYDYWKDKLIGVYEKVEVGQ